MRATIGFGALFAALVGCGGPAAGTERGPCRSDGTCDPGLVCLSSVCVAPERPDGGSLDSGSPRTDTGTLDSAAPERDAQTNAQDGASSDGGTDAAPPSMRRTYVVSSIDVPTTASESSATGRDLDGDGTIDNQLGQVFASFMSASDLDLQSNMNERVQRGDAIMLVELLAESFLADPTALGRAMQGANPTPAACTDPEDLVCGRHLEGSASFEVVATAPARSSGTIAAGRAELGPGASVLPIALDRAVTWLPLIGAHVEAETSPASLMAGTLTGVIPSAEIDATLIPSFHAAIVAMIARDCPEGACMPGSSGESLRQIFDASGDGMVTLEEVRTNSLARSLVAPDVDLDGDGTPDGLSAGVGFTAVGATFAAP